MKYRVVVSGSAEDDIQRLRGFLGGEASMTWPDAAEVIGRGIESLAEYPERGRRMLRLDRRELIVPFRRAAYVIQYRVYERVVLVARIFHSLEDRPLA